MLLDLCKKGTKSQMFILLDLYEKKENLITVARFASIRFNYKHRSLQGTGNDGFVFRKFALLRFDIVQAF